MPLHAYIAPCAARLGQGVILVNNLYGKVSTCLLFAVATLASSNLKIFDEGMIDALCWVWWICAHDRVAWPSPVLISLNASLCEKRNREGSGACCGLVAMTRLTGCCICCHDRADLTRWQKAWGS